MYKADFIITAPTAPPHPATAIKILVSKFLLLLCWLMILTPKGNIGAKNRVSKNKIINLTSSWVFKYIKIIYRKKDVTVYVNSNDSSLNLINVNISVYKNLPIIIPTQNILTVI